VIDLAAPIEEGSRSIACVLLWLGIVIDLCCAVIAHRLGEINKSLNAKKEDD
jgi:hypothetical protein